MFKYEGFSVGQAIRAMDFEPRAGRGDCCLEGTIEAVVREGTAGLPFAHYSVRITRDVWDGQDVEHANTRVGQLAAVPMESTMDYDGRVVAVLS